MTVPVEPMTAASEAWHRGCSGCDLCVFFATIDSLRAEVAEWCASAEDQRTLHETIDALRAEVAAQAEVIAAADRLRLSVECGTQAAQAPRYDAARAALGGK